MKAVWKESERLWRKGFVKHMGSLRDVYKIRWTRRRVNRMRLTEWRRELIPQVRWSISKKAVGDFNEEDKDGRAGVTADEERALHVDW